MSLSKIALGTVQFGMDYGINPASRQAGLQDVGKILRYAFDQGISLLDTAPSYGDSEAVLGRSDTSNFKIVTKTRHFSSTQISPDDISLMRRDFANSLSVMHRDSVYGVLVHNASDLLKEGSDKIFEQLVTYREEGKLDKVGVSIYSYEQLEKILQNFEIDLVQLPFNILDRRLIDKGMLNYLEQENIEVHARSIFLQGLLLMSKNNRPTQFDYWNGLWSLWDEWLNDHHLTALEASIRYAIARPEISSVLVGVDSEAQLREIIKASHGEIPEVPNDLFMDDENLLNPSKWQLE